MTIGTQFSHPLQETAMRWTSAMKPERKSNGAETATDTDHPPVNGVGSDPTDMAKLHKLTPSTQNIPTIVLGETGDEQGVEMDDESPNSSSSQDMESVLLDVLIVYQFSYCHRRDSCRRLNFVFKC